MADAEYTLYSHPFSFYSMMARHTIQLGRNAKDATPPRTITLRYVDHRANDTLREDYLVNVNPKGQVPSMTGGSLKQPLTDSISISLYLAEHHFPSMLPAQQAKRIRNLVKRIHAIYGLSYSNKTPTAEMTRYNPSPVEDILKSPDISPAYRAALEKKLAFHRENNATAFRPDVVAKARADLQAIFGEVLELRQQHGSASNDDEWIFGAATGPTVLDSHLLPVLLRCIDAGNAELVPEELRRWAGAKADGPAWQKVMFRRPTKWDPSMGAVQDMKEMMSL